MSQQNVAVTTLFLICFNTEMLGISRSKIVNEVYKNYAETEE